MRYAAMLATVAGLAVPIGCATAPSGRAYKCQTIRPSAIVRSDLLLRATQPAPANEVAAATPAPVSSAPDEPFFRFPAELRVGPASQAADDTRPAAFSLAPAIAAAPTPTESAPSARPLTDAPATSSAPAVRPLSLAADVESIYGPEEPPKPEEGVNLGGVHLELDVNYFTDYVYRGIDRSDAGGAEDAPNLQFDGKLSFDLGKLPHPFVGVFVNVFNDDPISRFQEVRPYAGFDLNLKPLLISAGGISYIYPERENQNTSEVFGRVELNDAFLFHRDRPFLTPYVYAAYDLHKYDGLYIEAGIKHDLPIPDIGVVLTAVADVGYVLNNGQFTLHNGEDTGFQHFDVGLIGTYALNPLINLSRRFGEWKLMGYLYYTDSINHDLLADTQIWGGMGIRFEY